MRIAANGVEISYVLEGRGPVVMLSHALGSTLSLWDAQVSTLVERYTVLRYDTRGHGASEVAPGPYCLEQLAADARGLLEALGIGAAHFVGLSLGGMVGMELALRHPERVRSLVLCDTTARYGGDSQEMWAQRIRTAETEGLEPLVERMMEVWFTPGFRRDHRERVDRVRRMIRSTDPRGYVAAIHALAGGDLTGRLRDIRCPTLVMAGEEDDGSPLATGLRLGVRSARFLHEGIPGSDLAVLPGAAHCPPVEAAGEFTRVLVSFLDRVEGAGGR